MGLLTEQTILRELQKQTELTQQLLEAQHRTNQLLEWVGRLVAAQQHSVSV